MRRDPYRRVARLEALTARMPAAISAERPRGEIGALLLDLLAAKLEASAAIADGARQLMRTPAWVAQQDAAELAQLGAYLDASALALGDRLARSAAREEADHAS